MRLYDCVTLYVAIIIEEAIIIIIIFFCFSTIGGRVFGLKIIEKKTNHRCSPVYLTVDNNRKTLKK